MFVLPRYVFADVMRPTALALGIMVGLVWLLQSMRFLDLMINKGLSIGVFLYLTVLLVPLLLTVILPLAVFAGAAYAFRRWQDDNELTALLAAGRSAMSVLLPALGWALLAVAAGYALYMDVLPRSTGAFKDLQYQLRNQDAQLLLEEGTFNQIGNNLMVYLKKRTTPTTIDTLLVHDTRDPNRPVTWYARAGEVAIGSDGYPQLVLLNGLRQEVGSSAENKAPEASMLEFTRYNLDIRQRLGGQSMDSRSREQQEYSMGELWDAAAKSPNAKDRFEMAAEANKRLLWPLSPIPLVLLAAAWLLRPPQRRMSSVRQLVGGSICAVAYQGALMGAAAAAQGGNIYALYGQWMIPLAGCALAWAVYERSRLV